jgi:hypothetical protein
MPSPGFRRRIAIKDRVDEPNWFMRDIAATESFFASLRG